MSYNFLSAVQKKYKRFGIFIPPDRDFIPGQDCKGKKPFKKSDECYGICLGTHGACSMGGLPMPCVALAALDKKFVEKIRCGIAGL